MTITVMRDLPREVVLPKSDTRAIIRTLEPEDEGGLLRFFSRIAEEDRFYLKEDVASPAVIAAWTLDVDYNRVAPLVALVGDQIVADVTLHRPRPGARRHSGEIRVLVDPEYRNRGLGALMVKELVDIAYDNAMDRVIFELVEGKENDAIKVAER